MPAKSAKAEEHRKAKHNRVNDLTTPAFIVLCV